MATSESDMTVAGNRSAHVFQDDIIYFNRLSTLRNRKDSDCGFEE